MTSFTSRFSKGRFLRAILYSFLIAIGLGIVIFLAWYVLLGFPPVWQFPIGLYTLGIGGLMLTVAGCIGPGRYQREYNLLLYQPERGSSFSETIPVAGFTVSDDITQASVYVNDHRITQIEFENGIGQTQIKRENVISTSLNKIWLESDDYTSNESYFTFFDYTEDMSDEEIDELYEAETSGPKKPIDEAREDYIERRQSHVGSIALGIGSTGILVMLMGALYDYLTLILYA